MKQAIRKRVLILVENRPFPQDVRVLPEARALVDAGYQVSVICPTAPKQALREYIDGIYVFRFPAAPDSRNFFGYLWEYGYSLLAMFTLSLLVWIRPGFDVIHAANPPDTAVFIALFYKLFGKRFVFDHHDLAPELYRARFNNKGHKFIYAALLWLERLSCQNASHVITTNQSYKELEIQRGHVPETCITIVRNGPDLSWLKPVDPDPYLQDKSEVIIGYAGTMGVQDGVDYLLRALQCLIDLGRTDFYCVLVGDGEALPKLKFIAEEMRLANYLLFSGWVDRASVARYLSAADICVAPEPSNQYNDASTMIKIMEYMALGKPIVAFDLPEHRFSAQNSALYACPNNEYEFALQIQILMDHPDLRQAMGQSGKKRIANELAWNHQKKHLIDAYSALFS
jgi:glycosyltransferase involved in cell wall biosynthesis